MPSHHLLGISGSLRQASTNTALVREAARLFDPADFTLADLNMPLYDGDLEQAEGVPAAAMTLADQILAADAVVVCTPEYNKGISGVLKNALDWVSRTGKGPWKGKPVAIMSAAAGRAGGERAQSMLIDCLIAFSPNLLVGGEVHLANSSNQFDETGRLTNERSEADLQALMDRLKATI